MREWEDGSWKRELAELPEGSLLYVHTPLCGTCALARRMLGVIEAMMPELDIQAANLNVMPGLAEQLKIESVPCLSILDKSGEWRNVYRFGSVVELSDTIRKSQEG
ncbi:thioredoxin family protein [Cohnella sp. AR92]|uniref:thioredoxin family protein n=1 Tax=Cohnella sp. AR92 TaxID=648716 RepID=UPI000F8CFAC1|nr:thioredoxin family protein [Cohnella sp. AR92]RUS46830.1 thioredoxin [Cohnella sp. AR92]